MRKLYRTLLLIFLVALFIGVIRISGLGDILSLATIKKYRLVLQQSVKHHYWTSVLIFMAAYAAAVAVSFPSASLITVVGGFLFGTIAGTFYSIVGATAGAMLLFVVIRYFFNNHSSPYQGERASSTARAIQEHGTHFLLFLRLIAIIPFFMVNIAAALSDVSLWTYTWTTFVGIIPGSIVYAYAGRELHEIHSFMDILSPSVLLAFVLLGLLALVPIFLKKEMWNGKGNVQ